MLVLEHSVRVNGEGVWDLMHLKELRHRSLKRTFVTIQPGHLMLVMNSLHFLSSGSKLTLSMTRGCP